MEEFKKELLSEMQQLIAPFLFARENDNELLTRDETAKLLKISLVTLHYWVKKDIIPAYRIGNKVRFKRFEIMNALQSMNRFQ